LDTEYWSQNLNAILNLQNLDVDVTVILNLEIRRLTCTIRRDSARTAQ